jgi:hypothetical protein
VRKTCAAKPAKDAGEEGDCLEFYIPEPGESVGVIGITRHGKSYFGKQWAAALLEMGERVIVWDPCHEWGKDAIQRKGTEPGPMARTVTIAQLEADPALLTGGRLNLAVRPEDILAPAKEIAEDFKKFAWLVRRVSSPGRIHVFVDEVALLKKEAEAELDDMAERWAKDELIPYFFGQRWMHFTVGMRAEIARLVAFKQVKASDLVHLGQDAGKAFARSVALLKPHKYRVADLRNAHADALAAVE